MGAPGRVGNGVAAAAGRRGGELSSAQATLLLQEETLRRGERERRALREKVTALERSLHLAEGERRAAQVGIAMGRGGGWWGGAASCPSPHPSPLGASLPVPCRRG